MPDLLKLELRVGYKPPDMGARIYTQVLWKSSQCFLPLRNFGSQSNDNSQSYQKKKRKRERRKEGERK